MHLFSPPPADGNLTRRQQTVLQILERDGKTDKHTAGRELHHNCRWCERARRRQFNQLATCEYASDDGRDVLDALVKRGLARKRRGGVYEAVRGRPGQGDLPAGY